MKLKKVLLFIMAILCSVAMFAQGQWGGVKGTVVNRNGRMPLAQAAISVSRGGETVATVVSDAEGKFILESLPNGVYDMTVKVPGFIDANVNVTVEGYVKDLIFVGMTQDTSSKDVDDSSFAEFDMDDSGYNDTPSIMFESNDPFNAIASYGFSSIRFRSRGYNNETQDVYLSGIKMNDAITGYSPYSLWSGLNEATRSKESTIGLESSEYGVGGFNGVTNIYANPSSVRPGWRFSALSNSALYRLRLMASYASGELDNGWSYAFNVSARIGGNDWVQGVFYRSFAYYAGVEKKFGDIHKLNLVTFAAPGSRGAQNASTQEVYDLMGTNMYNSNWGYQNGKLRNARVRNTFEPVTFLKYTVTPQDNLEASATVLWRTGKNGYTALDWYDAPDPRPDYYRNLPSYFYIEDPDYDRQNYQKYGWAYDMWTDRSGEFANYQHLDWDRLYNVNYGSADGRSKYIVEERRVDQNDINVAADVRWLPYDWMTLNGGVAFRWNRTRNYKIVNDLLGGEYYVNVDQFAERDFGSDPIKIQNDLDYYLRHGYAQKLHEGDEYGYNYLANVRDARLWANWSMEKNGWNVYAAGEAGYNSFWRDGIYRKGLFPDNSQGKSQVCSFFTYAAKAGASYSIPGGHRIYANAGYFNDAPTFSQAFVSPRTRNTVVKNLETTKTASFDLNYRFSNNGYDVRATLFWTKIMDQTDMMSFYDDSQNSFTNFAMTGIDQRHAGLEVGFSIPFFLKGLTLKGAASLGEYIYTSTPNMTQTIDNSEEVVFENQPVTYWKSHPKSYKKTDIGGGYFVYDLDQDGKYIVDKVQKHYVPSTPQIAANLGFNYRTSSYWFFELHGQFFAKSYLDMNPLYRTEMAVNGPDGMTSPEELMYMAAQEEFDPAFLLNASVGKSWYIKRKYNFGFSLQLNNILNNTNVKTGGYEQTRLIDSAAKSRYYRFDPKYFYMYGFNYMLNLYFRF